MVELDVVLVSKIKVNKFTVGCGDFLNCYITNLKKKKYFKRVIRTRFIIFLSDFSGELFIW
jgi:hypothetical protein